MPRVDEVLKEARRLTREDRRKLVSELEAELVVEESVPELPPGTGPYSKMLALVGTVHTDYTDVSSDKYKHLGEIYADNHEDE